MECAEAAYRMILEAYWAGDRDTLRDLCDDDSYQAFADAIAAREASGERLDNRLVRIGSTKIVAVEVGRSEARSEEHTSELQSLMRTSYAVFCLKKKKTYSHYY